MQKCITDCQDCHSTCTQTVDYCLQTAGKHAEASHIRLLLDCAEICHNCADFMLRDSDHYQTICGICAEICEQCAQDCDQFGGDTQMKACGDICRRTAQSCRQISGIKVTRKAA